MSVIEFTKTQLTTIYRELNSKKRGNRFAHQFYVMLFECIATVRTNKKTIYVSFKKQHKSIINPFIQAIKTVYNMDVEPVTIIKEEAINIIWDEESKEKKLIDDFLEGKIVSINLNGKQTLMNYLYNGLINRLRKKELFTLGTYNGCINFNSKDMSYEEFSIIYETVVDEICFRFSREIEYKYLYELEEYLYAYYRCIQVGNNNLQDNMNFEEWYQKIKWYINSKYDKEEIDKVYINAEQYFYIEPKTIHRKKKTGCPSLSKVLSLPEQ